MKEAVYAITGIASMLMLLVSTPAFAYHYGGYKWAGSTVNLCYSSTLGQLNIGLTPASGEVTQARVDWNDEPSVFTLNRTTGCDPVLGNWVQAADIGLKALTSISVSGSTITKATTTFDTSVNWTTNPSCNTSNPTMDYVGKHEFGHWVYFTEVYDASKSTVMWWDYDCTKQDTVKPDDSTELTSQYG